MASQSEVRALDNEIESRAPAPPRPPALSSVPSAPATPATSDLTPGSTALSLGIQLPKIITTSEAMDAAMKGMQENNAQLNSTLPGMQSQVEQRRGELSGELGKPMPQAPKLHDIPQFQPKQLSNQELTLFAGFAMAFAGLGTKAMRGDLTMAMTAAGSALKGFGEGNLQQSKLDLENFKRSMDSVIAQNQKMSEEYRGILENRKLSLSQKMQSLQVAAASRDDQIMLASLKGNQYKQIFDLEAHRINAANQVATRAAQIYNAAVQHHESLQLRKEIAGQRAQASAAKADSGLSPEATQYLAAYVQLNGRMPIGFSRQNPMAIQTMNQLAETASKAGIQPSQWAAAGPVTHAKLSSLADFEKKRNNIQAFEGMLDLNIDILKKISSKVDRTGSPYANKSILWLQQNAANDPDVSEYLFQVSTVQVEIARVLNNPNLTGELSDSARHEMQEVVNGNLPHEALSQVLNRAQSDAKNRATKMDAQRDKIIKEIQNPLASTGSSEAPGGPVREFATEADAAAAGLTPGTRVKIGGKTGTWH